MKGRSTITLQDLINCGLNAFAVQLVAESINGHHDKEVLRRPLSFMLDDVIFTLSLSPERGWTHELLLEILTPISNIVTMDTDLIRFARTFVAADEELRAQLAHVAVILIDKYSLWPYVPPAGAAVEKKAPPPISITPSATPSSCLANDFESARRDKVHVRIIEDGSPSGYCWCGVQHIADVVATRDIHVTTTRAEEV